MLRIKNPTKPAFTWRRQTPRIQSRLDYWYISDSLFDTVTECDILPPVFGSDHCPIGITIKSLQNCQNLMLVVQSRKRCANTGQHWFGVSCLLGTTDDNHNGLFLDNHLLFVLFVIMNNLYTCMNVLICGL